MTSRHFAITPGRTLLFIVVSCVSAFGQTNNKKPTPICDTRNRLTLTDEGYQRLNPDDPKDLRLKPNPGLIESEPGLLRPAAGYCWANPSGFKVEPVAETSSSTNLPGTEWEVKIKQPPPEGMFQVAAYAFGDGGKVVLTIATGNAASVPPRIQYNSPGPGRVEEERGRATVVPGIDPASILSAVSEEGTYKQNGDSLHMEFPDHVVDATIKGTRIEGEIRYKESGQKDKWVVTKSAKPR
jgi:hypothetical protein